MTSRERRCTEGLQARTVFVSPAMSLNDLLRASRQLPGAGAFAGLPPFRIVLIAAFHLAAIAVMFFSEYGLVEKAVFLLTWALLNCFFLMLTRRPATAAALSLSLIVALIVLSRLKHEVIWMTINFLDVMIVDTDTIQFLMTLFPNLWLMLAIGFVASVPVFVLIWRRDSYRVRRRVAALGIVASLLGITGVSFAVPTETWEIFLPGSHISKFARSGVESLTELYQHGFFESDADVVGRLVAPIGAVCPTTSKPPHIVLVHDESSFDIRAVPGVKVPENYGPHFKSFDGKQRKFMVESNGGSSWFAEYNVLAGLSSRSYGRFSYFLTRVAAGRVERGLPRALQRCGYHTYTLYPSLGAFMSARGFHTSVGIEHFLDSKAMGTSRVEPDNFYFDKAADIIGQQRGKGPLFMFVYLAANHYPWTDRWRPDLNTEWKDLGNPPKVDEYLRRQAMSADYYAAFVARLKREFPGEQFLIVRYGDHQPELTANLIEPGAPDSVISQRMSTFDPRYFSTYYGVDALNFKPRNIGAALDTLDAPYLPLVVQQLAGLPLDASFTEQKKIFERCKGVYYGCSGGAESRRFNRLLIDAGLIKGL